MLNSVLNQTLVFETTKEFSTKVFGALQASDIANVELFRSDSLRLFDNVLALLQNRILLTLVALYILYRLYHFFFQPLIYIKANPDIGYLPSSGQSHRDRAEEVRRRRRTGDLPPVYPNGWFRLMDSMDLPVKGVRQISALGLELAVFRAESGRVGVLDAYCPHLGANLAAGGYVVGDALECPFHGWDFNCDGVCTKIAYASTIPEVAKVKAYTSLERNGHILIWYHAEGEEPSWEPPVLEELVNGTWSFRGKSQHHINSHIQEVPENAADVAHLSYLHGPCLLSGIDLRNTQTRFQFSRHTWDAAWAPCSEEGKKHLSVLNLKHSIQLFERNLPILDLDVTATQVGPGLVYLTWKSIFGTGVFVQALTPIEPLMQELTHAIYCSWSVPQWLAKIYLMGEAMQVERDVMVWNNKRYQGKPVLVKEDELIGKHRRWYRQFYSENSPTYAEAIKGMDW